MLQIESQGAVEVITPKVALNHETVAPLRSAIADKTFAGQPMLVIDMNRVPLIDSAGLEALLDIQQMLRDSAGTMKLAGLTQLCEDILRVTGLAERFETYADLKSAVGSFVR